MSPFCLVPHPPSLCPHPSWLLLPLVIILQSCHRCVTTNCPANSLLESLNLSYFSEVLKLRPGNNLLKLMYFLPLVVHQVLKAAVQMITNQTARATGTTRKDLQCYRKRMEMPLFILYEFHMSTQCILTNIYKFLTFLDFPTHISQLLIFFSFL